MFNGRTRPTNTIAIKLLPVTIGRSTIRSALQEEWPVLDVRIDRRGSYADAYVVFSNVTGAKKCLV